MSGFTSMKMKRKELEEVYDDFSDFSLTSQARKMRRLNADLPPIIEEEETSIPPSFCQPDERLDVNAGQLAAGIEEVMPSFLPNEERALVLYKPVNTPFFQSPNSSNVSFTVNADLVPGLKADHREWIWSGHPNIMTEEADDEAFMDENVASSNSCRAVVPWVATNQHPVSQSQQERKDWAAGNRFSERMECEDMDVAKMEVEEDRAAYRGGEEQAWASAGMGGVEGMTIQQWQQQHCMTPQIPPNNSTPIMWSW